MKNIILILVLLSPFSRCYSVGESTAAGVAGFCTGVIASAVSDAAKGAIRNAAENFVENEDDLSYDARERRRRERNGNLAIIGVAAIGGMIYYIWNKYHTQESPTQEVGTQTNVDKV